MSIQIGSGYVGRSNLEKSTPNQVVIPSPTTYLDNEIFSLQIQLFE